MTQIARWISILAHPFVMVAVLVAVPAMRQSSGNAVQSELVVVLAVVVPIAVLMVRQVRRGRWSNVDASKPSERPALFLVALTGLVAALGWLLLNDPHSFLVRGMLVTAAFLLLAAVLTRWVKLSLHVAFAALAATALVLLGSAVGYALVAVVPMVFWSRLVLARHSVHELLVGLALGVLYRARARLVLTSVVQCAVGVASTRCATKSADWRIDMVKGLGTVIYHVTDLNRRGRGIRLHSSRSRTSTNRSTSASTSPATSWGSIPIRRGHGLDPVAASRTGALPRSRARSNTFVHAGATVVTPIQDVGDGIKVATVADPFGEPDRPDREPALRIAEGIVTTTRVQS